ncbi:MAG: hypothetical protein H0T58_04140 [Gemmatimonadales bacterium]|nr:hypothetical protein [Gemmatimonadales bacterium]
MIHPKNLTHGLRGSGPITSQHHDGSDTEMMEPLYHRYCGLSHLIT